MLTQRCQPLDTKKQQTEYPKKKERRKKKKRPRASKISEKCFTGKYSQVKCLLFH